MALHSWRCPEALRGLTSPSKRQPTAGNILASCQGFCRRRLRLMSNVRFLSSMQWSALKKKAKALWVPGLDRILDIHVASFRKSDYMDPLARATFVSGGREIWEASDTKAWKYQFEAFGLSRWRIGHGHPAELKQAEELGYIDIKHFMDLTFQYVTGLAIEDASKSHILLHQIYAVLDRRSGVRVVERIVSECHFSPYSGHPFPAYTGQ
ncbi:MAG: hypothetical protein IV097_14700 [Burkholderiaceae bacterium]|nr:hypothetical protein [Burkholderiaceae bacterium]